MDLKDLKIERQPAHTRRRGNPWPVRIIALLLLAAVGWVMWPKVSDFLDKVRLPVVRTLIVTEATPSTAAAVRGTAANGYVVAARRAALSSDVPGRIVELNVREGSVVKKGDIVARLFADEYRAAWQRAKANHRETQTAIKRAKAALEVAKAEIEQANKAVAKAAAQRDEGQTQLDFAVKDLARITVLATTGIEGLRKKQVAERDRDAAKTRLDSLIASVNTSLANHETVKQRAAVADIDIDVATDRELAARASLDQARATLDKTDVRAPFDGIVVLKDAEIGEVVSPNVQGGSNARGAVCTMVDFDSLEIQANVPETSLATVRLGAAVDVFLDAYPEQRLTGVVDRIWPTADRSKATVEVRIIVADKTLLRPEYGVRVVFRDHAETDLPVEASTQQPKVMIVPESAIVAIGGVQTAFVLERDIVQATPVTVGERKKGRVSIVAGLTPGQRIVLAPSTTLQDKDRVRLADDGDT